MDAHVPLLIKAEHGHIARHNLAPSEVIRNFLSSVRVTMLSAMSSQLISMMMHDIILLNIYNNYINSICIAFK